MKERFTEWGSESLLLNSPAGNVNYTQILNVQKRRVVAPGCKPFLSRSRRKNIVKATSLKMHMFVSRISGLGGMAFISALLDGTPQVFSVSDEIVVGNLSPGQHSITVQSWTLKRKSNLAKQNRHNTIHCETPNNIHEHNEP